MYVPDDADGLYFFSLFINDDLLNNVVLETNRYAKDYITVEKETGDYHQNPGLDLGQKKV